jgi:hypothetical protein
MTTWYIEASIVKSRAAQWIQHVLMKHVLGLQFISLEANGNEIIC